MESIYKSQGLLSGKNAIVTGANRGIGSAIVEAFAKHGANIWACARKKSAEFEDNIARIAHESGVIIRPVYFDLADAAQIKMAMECIFSEKKDIDILVNNAGAVLKSNHFNMTKVDAMKSIFDINFFAPVILMQHVTRKMILRKKGSIVNIISIAALDADYGQLEYISSKAALGVATKKIAQELAPYNIRVNAIAPGLIDTQMLNEMSDKMKTEALEKIFLKRLGTPGEIANVAVFFGV